MRAIYKKELKSYFTSADLLQLLQRQISGVFLGADRIVFLPV